jgi:hypothetical protein
MVEAMTHLSRTLLVVGVALVVLLVVLIALSSGGSVHSSI